MSQGLGPPRMTGSLHPDPRPDRAARGHPRARPHRRGAGPVGDPDAGRLGRRGDQDRDADRRPRPQFRASSATAAWPRSSSGQPQQALARPRPEDAGGRRGAAPADPDRRCAGDQHPPGRAWRGSASARRSAGRSTRAWSSPWPPASARTGRTAPGRPSTTSSRPPRASPTSSARRQASRASCRPSSPTRSPAWRWSRRCSPRCCTASAPARPSSSRCRCSRRITAFVAVEHLGGHAFDPPIGKPGYKRLRHRKPAPTKDGWMTLLPYTAAHWRAFFTEAGRRGADRAARRRTTR